MSLRIGIDGGCWSNWRGYGRYTRNLLSALAARDDGNEYLMFLDAESAAANDLPPGFQPVVVSLNEAPGKAASAAGRRSVVDLLRMSRAVARYRLDAFFFPSVYTYFPLIRPVPAIVAIHDVIAERHPGMIFPNARAQFFWRAKLALAHRQARMILTVSEHAATGIREQFGIADKKLRVILESHDPVFRVLPEARDPSELLPGHALTPGLRYLVYVGGLSPHKNLGVLIEAFRRVAPRFPTLRLLLVGDYSGDVFYSAYADLKRQVDQNNLSGQVCFAGFIDDATLIELLNRTELLVMPSLEEGFGLPAFEAAACGTPSVVSEVGPAASLLKDAVIAFPPRDVESLVAALDRVLGDPVRRERMAAAALARSREFSWQRSAAEFSALLTEVAR